MKKTILTAAILLVSANVYGMSSIRVGAEPCIPFDLHSKPFSSQGPFQGIYPPKDVLINAKSIKIEDQKTYADYVACMKRAGKTPLPNLYRYESTEPQSATGLLSR